MKPVRLLHLNRFLVLIKPLLFRVNTQFAFLKTFESTMHLNYNLCVNSNFYSLQIRNQVLSQIFKWTALSRKARMEGNTMYKKLLIVTTALLLLLVMAFKYSCRPEDFPNNDRISISTNILDIDKSNTPIVSDNTTDVSDIDKTVSETEIKDKSEENLSESTSDMRNTKTSDRDDSTGEDTDDKTLSNSNNVDFDLKNFPGIHSTLSPNDIATIKKSQQIMKKIRENCKAQNVSTVWNFWDRYTKPRLLIAKSKYRILYGSNPKTGSTSFKRFLFTLDGVTDGAHEFHGDPDGHYEIVQSKNFFQSKSDFESYVKMMAIRNPIVRVVSAFRDKQLRKGNYFKTPPNITDAQHFAIFLEKRLARPRENNVHLMPQWKQMNICRFPYDLLIQVEEIERYIPLIQKLTGTEDVEYPGSRKDRGKDTHDSKDFVYEYWRELNDKQKQIVFDKYNMDFVLFGYTKPGEQGFPLLKYNDEIENSL